MNALGAWRACGLLFLLAAASAPFLALASIWGRGAGRALCLKWLCTDAVVASASLFLVFLLRHEAAAEARVQGLLFGRRPPQ